MYFDRFDICEAWYLHLTETHGGQFSREYRRLCHMGTYFRPPMGLCDADSLTENGREIYSELTAKWEAKHPPKP
jgi:hypothetical protein